MGALYAFLVKKSGQISPKKVYRATSHQPNKRASPYARLNQAPASSQQQWHFYPGYSHAICIEVKWHLPYYSVLKQPGPLSLSCLTQTWYLKLCSGLLAQRIKQKSLRSTWHNHCKVQVGVNESAVLQHQQQQTQSLLKGLRNGTL